jgi:hypothetical protein
MESANKYLMEGTFKTRKERVDEFILLQCPQEPFIKFTDYWTYYGGVPLTLKNFDELKEDVMEQLSPVFMQIFKLHNAIMAIMKNDDRVVCRPYRLMDYTTQFWNEPYWTSGGLGLGIKWGLLHEIITPFGRIQMSDSHIKCDEYGAPRANVLPDHLAKLGELYTVTPYKSSEPFYERGETPIHFTEYNPNAHKVRKEMGNKSGWFADNHWADMSFEYTVQNEYLPPTSIVYNLDRYRKCGESASRNITHQIAGWKSRINGDLANELWRALTNKHNV